MTVAASENVTPRGPANLIPIIVVENHATEGGGWFMKTVTAADGTFMELEVNRASKVVAARSVRVADGERIVTGELRF